MTYSSKFFTNKDCEYYPCHNMDNINCLFCYCPLYNMKCCGEFTMINGKKDCSNCTFPHIEDNYDKIIEYIQ